MDKEVIMISTIKDDDKGYDKILKIANIILENPRRHFDLNFSQCAKIEHNAVVLLGALSRYVDFHNTLSNKIVSGIFSSSVYTSAGVMFLVDTMSSPVLSYLVDNNLLSHFTSGRKGGYHAGDYIGYREHNNLLDADKIADHLENQWLSADKLKLSPILKESIVSRIFEIFMNAYGHGVSVQHIEKLGVYSCGQYDKKEKKLNISVLDFGPGIVENVRKKRSEITNSIDAMKWALVKGNSTGTDSHVAEMPRGLGLELLHAFVSANDGELRIYSNDVKVVSNKKEGIIVEKSKEFLSGTLVSIKINCDGRTYQLSSESPESHPQYF
jgi:anti-sigma regulatory factor (Ser/Thr protein kinase)